MKLYEFEDEQPKKILVDGGIIAFLQRLCLDLEFVLIGKILLID